DQVVQGHLFRARVLFLNGSNEIVQIELEIINVETSLAKSRAFFFSLINRSIEQSETESVGLLVGRNDRDFSENDIVPLGVSLVDDQYPLGGISRRNDFLHVNKNLGKVIIKNFFL